MRVRDALSFQLYSARSLEPLEAQLALLRSVGITKVEPYRMLLDDAERLARGLAENGLTAPSTHVGLNALEEDFAGTTAKMKRLGITRAAVPAVPPELRAQPAAGWIALGKALAGFAERLKDEGIALAWHNHDFEFRPTETGALPLDLIFENAPGVSWQADLAWIVRGGADPIATLKRYAGRVSSGHIKDIAPAGQCADEDGWADVGHGTLDWAALIPALKAAGADLFVLEHDTPNDVARFARRSVAAVDGWVF